MHRQHPNRQFRRLPYRPPEADIAAVYNRAGDGYLHFADGDPRRLFAFQGPHAYADRRVWRVICKRLSRLRATGATSISVVDAGCGPGTWLRRVVTQAHQLGFTHIAARGFDVTDAQIQTARRIAGDLARLPGVSLRFGVADLTDRMPEASGSVDITLSLYSVLSHLPTAILPRVAAEIARVTRGHLEPALSWEQVWWPSPDSNRDASRRAIFIPLRLSPPPKGSWSGLSLHHCGCRRLRCRPSSLYTFPIARAWLGISS
jgi:SAM-dependent methyltransferase